MHPCKALLKVRDDVQGARSSQSGLDSLLVPKSVSDLIGLEWSGFDPKSTPYNE